MTTLRFRTELEVLLVIAEQCAIAEQILTAGEALRAVEKLRISVTKDTAARANLARIATVKNLTVDRR